MATSFRFGRRNFLVETKGAASVDDETIGGGNLILSAALMLNMWVFLSSNRCISVHCLGLRGLRTDGLAWGRDGCAHGRILFFFPFFFVFFNPRAANLILFCFLSGCCMVVGGKNRRLQIVGHPRPSAVANGGEDPSGLTPTMWRRRAAAMRSLNRRLACDGLWFCSVLVSGQNEFLYCSGRCLCRAGNMLRLLPLSSLPEMGGTNWGNVPAGVPFGIISLAPIRSGNYRLL